MIYIMYDIVHIDKIDSNKLKKATFIIHQLILQSSSASGFWLPLSSIAIVSILSIVKGSDIDVWHSRSILFERGIGIIPLVRLFKERVVEGNTLRSRDFVVLMWEPAVPFGRNHISVGTPNREIVIVLYPSSLIAVYLGLNVRKGSKSS